MFETFEYQLRVDRSLLISNIERWSYPAHAKPALITPYLLVQYRCTQKVGLSGSDVIYGYYTWPIQATDEIMMHSSIIIAFYKRDKEIAYQLYPTYAAAGRPNKVSLVWPRCISSEGELIRDLTVSYLAKLSRRPARNG